jgi:FKBP-type peptidyl-prolyl cis-trans isomerase FkpA
MSVIFTFASCTKEVTVEEQFNIDVKIIDDYLKTNNLNAQKTSDGIYYIIEKEGSAEKPKITSKVTVTYKGTLLDGSVFDSREKAQFFLYNTIQGWQKGIPKFGREGKGKLIIPSKFAYGTSDQLGEPNAILIFDIEVFDF